MSTQKITSADGVHSISVSGSGKFVLDTYSNLTSPNKIDLNVVLGKSIKNLLTSKNPYANKIIGQTEIFTIKGADGTDLYCRLIKPSNFDPNKKYPVVFYVYNGPHVQLVTNSFLGGASLWMHYLAEDGYLVFTVDGRGSSNRGKAFEQAIHRQLGTAEIQDQMSGVNWLKSQKYVDASRMGIHGWSFGGFMTTNMMLRTPGTFKVGVAGGPVIDWKLYEVMYTERYMDTPQENPDGYKAADLTQYVKNLQGKLLMIHGTDDDVVVMQHNMKFMKACIDNGKQVDFFAYPGHPHNVRGKDRVHLMTKVIEYLEANL
jgi:dipeptidyl-peptidase-4